MVNVLEEKVVDYWDMFMIIEEMGMFYVGEKLEVWVCKMFEMIMCLVDGIVKVCKGELM